MGYCVDVHICVNKEDLPILYSCDEMYMFKCSYRTEGLVYAYIDDIKIGDWWDSVKKAIEQCKEYHWIMIGEDGEQSEDYSNEPLMSVVTTVDVPPKIEEQINLTTCKLHQEVLNVLKLALPKEYILDSSYIVHTSDCVGYEYEYAGYVYSINNKAYITKEDGIGNDAYYRSIIELLNKNYLLIPIKENVYEIQYKP